MKKLAFLAMIGLLWVSGQGFYEAWSYKAPVTEPCDAALAGAPRSGWVHFTGCRVNVMEATYMTRGSGEVTDEIYLVLAPRGASATQPVHYLLATKDPDVIAVVKEMAAIDGKDKRALYGFLAKNITRLVRDKDVIGMPQTWLDRSNKTDKRLRESNKNLADDFVILDEGRQPGSVGSALGALGGAVVAFLFLGALGLKS